MTTSSSTHLEALAELGFINRGLSPSQFGHGTFIPGVVPGRSTTNLIAKIDGEGTQIIVGTSDLLFVVTFDADTPGDVLKTAVVAIMDNVFQEVTTCLP